MFTGIVKEVGRVRGIAKAGDLYKLSIESKTVGERSDIGASISINGVCLTVTNKEKGIIHFDAVEETVRKTNLGDLISGNEVNLEDSLKTGEAMGGHFVLGHVDCVGRIIDIRKHGREDVSMKISVPKEFACLIVKKGSVALEGISLTVGEITGNQFEAHLVPHTLKSTTLGLKSAGDALNIEFDIVGKYVARLLEGTTPAAGNLTEDFLRENGF